MLALFAACALVQTPVSYDQPMSTVADVLAVLAKSSGKTIEQTGIGHFPIFIEAKDVPLPDLLTRISEATDSELSTTAKGYRLDRSPSRAQKARQIEAAELAARLKAVIDGKKADWEKSDQWSNEAVQAKAERLMARLEGSMKSLQESSERGHYAEVLVGGSTSDMPAAIVQNKLLASLPATAWVPETPGGILRLSDKPNRYQRKIGVDLSGAYRQVADAHNRMRSAVSSRMPHKNVYLGFEDHDLAAGDLARTVVLADWRHPSGVGLMTYLVDQSGNVVSHVNTSYFLPSSNTSGDPDIVSERQVPVSPVMMAVSKALLTTSTATRNRSMSMMFDDASVTLGRTVKTVKQPEEVLARLCANVDPFEELAGGALRAVADEEKKSVVAVLPESMFKATYGLARRDKFPLKEFGAILKANDVAVKREGDWMTVTPRLAVMLDRNLVNRKALAKFSKSIRDQGFASMEDTAEYIRTRTGRIQNEAMDHVWIRAISGTDAENFINDQDGYRLYAGLSTTMKMQGTFSGPLSSTLLPAVGVRLDSHFGGAQVFGDGLAIMSSTNPRTRWIGEKDVSEPLAAGTIQFDLSTQESETLFAQRKTEGGGRFIRPAEIGIYRLMARKTEYADFNDELLPYDTFQKATSRRVQMVIRYAGGANGGLIVMDDLADNRLAPGQGKWTWDSLPAEIKNQILEAEKKYVNRIGGG